MIDIRVLTGAELEQALPDLAALRIRVFRDWPYLYDGDMAYELSYLEPFRSSPRAVIIGAFEGDQLIGAATGAPLSEHADGFAQAFQNSPLAQETVFYCAESVLLPEYRGQGIGHRFFDLREAHATRLGFEKIVFCGVLRPQSHPLKPRDARSLEPFWRSRGYQPLNGVVARFEWKDIDHPEADEKRLQFWIRDLKP